MPYKRDKLNVIYVRERDFNMCQCCYRYGESLDAHHIVSLFLDGADEPENMILLCSDCHSLAIESEDANLIDYQRIGGAATAMLLAKMVMRDVKEYSSFTIEELRRTVRRELHKKFLEGFNKYARYMMNKYGDDYFDDDYQDSDIS